MTCESESSQLTPGLSPKVQRGVSGREILLCVTLLGILFLGLVLRIRGDSLLIEFGEHGGDPRELMSGFRLIHTNPFSLDPKFQNTLVQVLTDPRTLNTPLLPFLVGLTARLLDIPLTEWNVYLGFAFMGVLNLLSIFFLAGRIGGKTAALLATGLLAVIPFHVWCSHHKCHYMLSLFADAGFLLAWWKALDTGRRSFLALASGLLCFVILVDNFFPGIIIVAGALWFFYSHDRARLHDTGTLPFPSRSFRSLWPFLLPPAGLLLVQVAWAAYAIFWSGSQMGMIPYFLQLVRLVQVGVRGLTPFSGTGPGAPGYHPFGAVRFANYLAGVGVVLLIGAALVHHLVRWRRLSPSEKGIVFWFCMNALLAPASNFLSSFFYVLYPGLLLGANSLARFFPAPGYGRPAWAAVCALLFVLTLNDALYRVLAVRVPGLHRVSAATMTFLGEPVLKAKLSEMPEEKRKALLDIRRLNHGEKTRWLWESEQDFLLLTPQVQNVGQKSLGYWIRRYSDPNDIVFVNGSWRFGFMAEFYMGKQQCRCANSNPRLIIDPEDPAYDNVSLFIHMLKIPWDHPPEEFLRQGVVQKVGIIKRGEEELVHIYSKRPMPLRVLDVRDGDRAFDEEYGRIDRITPTAYMGYSPYLR